MNKLKLYDRKLEFHEKFMSQKRSCNAQKLALNRFYYLFAQRTKCP